MTVRTLYVTVSPSVMKWARDSAGLDVEAVARKLNVSVTTVKGWELGTKPPTLKALNELTSFYKRPLAAFFLPEPPQEPPMPTDFRVLPGVRRLPLSKKTRLAIRRARRVQSLATELMEMAAHGELIANIGKASPMEDPEVVAARERDRLGIGIKDQFSWNDEYAAFSKWREGLESLRVLVLQAQIPVQEARGFSLADGLLPTIVVSISDFIRARMFTLFHEYAHLIIDTPGICIPNEDAYDSSDTQRTEEFCNHFAGALLVPQDVLRSRTKPITPQSEVDDAYVQGIAELFKVSRPVILRRMLLCGLITRDQYESKLPAAQPTSRPSKKAFGVSPARRCVLQNGTLFVSLALEARSRELITYSDLADYLSVNLKHLDKVEALLHQRRYKDIS